MGEQRCGLKDWSLGVNTTANKDRTSINVTTSPFTNDELCALNSGILAVQNGSAHLDLLIYNHAAFADPIVTCSVTVSVPSNGGATPQLSTATVRRIGEAHANPLATWISMGAPDYTSAAQNAALLNASQLAVEPLSQVATSVAASTFVLDAPPHSVFAVRVAL